MKHSLAPALFPLAVIAASIVALIAAGNTATAQTQPSQCGDFMRLRNVAQERAAAVRRATQHKANRKDVCSLMTRFSVAEEAVVKFLIANKTWCGVPDVAIKQAKLGHEQTLKFRKAACAEAPKPAQPTLSDALTQPVDTGGNTSTGGGTLDSLSGNPLAR